MKQLLIILLGLIGVAYGQSSPTSAKTRFVNGLYVGTKLDSYFAAADSNAIYWRADSALMAKYKGTARALAFAVSGGYLPISDTAAMLQPFIQYSDTTGLFSNVVRTFGTQTIGGNKTFTNDIFASTARIGIGAGGNSSNSVLGYNVFTANTTGTKNTAMGENSLSSNVSATDNTAFGWYSLDAATGSGNTGIGSGALGTNTSGSNNIALGFGAGEYVAGTNPNTTGTNSIYIGFNTKAAANGETNQTVIGHNATGNGSNTVTIGNSSVTGNYFNGFLKQTSVTSALVKASSTGVLEAAVAGTDYVAPSALSGYLPLSGGTLTGALNGTSLSMSGAVNANSLVIKNSGVPAAQFYRDLDVTVVGSAGQGIEFGARNGASTYVAGAAIYGGLENPATSGNLVFQTLSGGTLGTRLTIASTGAATFSSSVTATNATLTNSTASTSTTTGALIVTGGVGVGGNITVPRITSAGSTPTIAITSATNTVGTGATVSVSGNDMAGVVTLNTGTGITNAGATMQLTFASAYSTTTPVVVVTVRAGGKIVYSATSSTTTATFTAFDQLGDSTTYTINYIIIAR